MKSSPQCGSGSSCSPNGPTYSCYASTNRRSRQATYRAVCSKLATLLDNADRANRKAEVRAELTKRLDVKRPDIRARGRKYRSRIFWIDGRRTRAAAKAPQRKKAVPFPSDRPSILIIRRLAAFNGPGFPCSTTFRISFDRRMALSCRSILPKPTGTWPN
jgi:hypothetical protein